MTRKIIQTTLFTLIVTIAVLFIQSPITTSGQVSQDDLQDELSAIEQELADIQARINDVNSAIASEESKQTDLSNDVNYLGQLITQTELEIRQKELDIQKKETEVKILERELNDLEIQLASLEIHIAKLEDTANEIVNSIYVETKSSSFIDILLSSDKSTDFLSSFTYHTSLAESDQATLEELTAKRDEVLEYRNDIQEKTEEQKKIAYAIQLQQDDLERAKEELTQQQLDKTYLLNNSYITVDSYEGQLGSLTQEQQEALAQRNLVLQQIQQTIGVGNGQYVAKGTWIAKEGNTGCGTGNHGHIVVLNNNQIVNPCSVFPTANNWCGTENASLDWPMRNDLTWFVTGGYNAYHQAVDVSYSGSSDGKYFVAPFAGYVHHVQSACDVSWCNQDVLGIPGVTCNTPNANGAVLCENQDCSQGWQIGFWHVE